MNFVQFLRAIIDGGGLFFSEAIDRLDYGVNGEVKRGGFEGNENCRF